MEKHYWKKILTSAAIYFAVISLFIFIVYIITSGGSIYAPAFSVARMLFILCFCLVFSIANSFLSSDKLNGFYKLLIHGILTIGGFFSLIYAPMTADVKYQASLNGLQYSGANIFVAIGLVVIIYAVCYGTYSAIASKKNKKKNTRSEYKSVYRNK